MIDFYNLLGFVPLFIIDGGHGATTPQKRTPQLPDGTVIQEYQFNKPTAAFTAQDAERLGFKTLLTSPDDYDTPLSIRTSTANMAYLEYIRQLNAQGIDTSNKNVAVFVSIHYNVLGTEFQVRANGIETFYYTGSVIGQTLAQNVLDRLIESTGLVNRGAKPANFYVLRHTMMPATLAECGFMDYLPEALLMLNVEYQKTVAQAIVAGVCDFYGVPYQPPQ
ncbi:MAG TPA: N-acetylmuramoyl-L-alanine amidase [Epulopiscium sp.]|nr:N-acetylmuramoyl-L-alanine amidase [Candidatus Epulonipiscium sp.]